MQVASGVTIRPDLGVGMTEYFANINDQFMAEKILPVFSSQVKSGEFGKIAIAQLTNDVGDLGRAPGSAYARVKHEVTQDNFTCREYGIEEPIDDGEAELIGTYFDAEMNAAELCGFKLKRKQEQRAAALLFNASNFAGYTAGVSTEWSSVNGTPYADIQDILLTLKQNVGGVIGGRICLAVSEKVFRNMSQTTEIQGKIRGGTGSAMDRTAEMISAASMAAILGVNDVFFSAAQAGGADVWDDEYALLFIQGTGTNLRGGPNLGRTFQWTADCASNAMVETYRQEEIRSNVVRVRQHLTEKVFTYAAGYLLSNITA